MTYNAQSRACQYNAEWCKYEPKSLHEARVWVERDDLTALQLRVDALEHKLLNHRHCPNLPSPMTSIPHWDDE